MSNATAPRKQVVITARDMYAAQGFELDADTRANLQAKADRFRLITGETGPTDIHVPVLDLNGAKIGELVYLL